MVPGIPREGRLVGPLSRDRNLFSRPAHHPPFRRENIGKTRSKFGGDKRAGAVVGHGTAEQDRAYDERLGQVRIRAAS